MLNGNSAISSARAARTWTDYAASGAGTASCRGRSARSRRSCRPPNEPLLISTRRSPGRASATSAATSRRDRLHRGEAAERAASRRRRPISPRATGRGIHGPRRAASRRAPPLCVPSFIVLDRGSSTAITRPWRVAPPHPVEGGRDGRRVVREIVVDRDVVDDTAHFEPAFHATEPAQRLESRLRVHAGMRRRCQRGQRVGRVVLAELVPVHATRRHARRARPRRLE